jgi:hypothetical protein
MVYSLAPKFAAGSVMKGERLKGYLKLKGALSIRLSWMDFGMLTIMPSCRKAMVLFGTRSYCEYIFNCALNPMNSLRDLVIDSLTSRI